MKKLLALILSLTPLGLPTGAWAVPQSSGTVVTTCGTISPQYLAGRDGPLTVDLNGLLCSSSGGGGGGTSSTFGAAFPATGTAIGVKSGANMVNLTADGSNNLNINCVVGCAAGTTSNASSGVATSSTNGASVSWLYGFNGTTWDQLQVDASKFLKVILQTGSTTIATQATAASLNAQVVGPAASGAANAGNPVKTGATYNATLPTFADGNVGDLQTGTRGSLHVALFANDQTTALTVSATNTDALGVVATGSVLQVNSIGRVYNGTSFDRMQAMQNSTNSVGTGITAAGQVSQCDDTSPTVITENSFGNIRMDCATHAEAVEILPTTSASAGIAPVVSASLETGHVLKASAGNLYGVEVVTTTVAGYLEVFNSTTVPAAGAVTPVAFCYVGAFGTCALQFNPPLTMSTGISAAFSASTTPFTKTDSATAAISGQSQ